MMLILTCKSFCIAEVKETIIHQQIGNCVGDSHTTQWWIVQFLLLTYYRQHTSITLQQLKSVVGHGEIWLLQNQIPNWLQKYHSRLRLIAELLYKNWCAVKVRPRG